MTVKTNFPKFVKKVEQRQYDRLVAATKYVEGQAIKNTESAFKKKDDNKDSSLGNLRGNMYHRVIKKGKELIGRVGNSTIYAAIREFGGTIKADKAEYLQFQIDGHWVKVKQVTQKATPYLTPAIESSKKAILRILSS